MSSCAPIIDRFLAGGQTLRRAVAGMTREQLLSRPVPGKWSTLEVVCHLADSEMAWAHRIKCVIAEDRPLLIGYDESRFAAGLAYHERDLEEELTLFEQMRGQMARILRALPAVAWSRVGVHSERGLITLEQQVKVLADHVPHHLKFIREKRQVLGV
jgi:hypothetical protein